MHYLAQRGSVESLDYLIGVFGADAFQINLEDKFGNTPLAVAVDCKHLTFAERLIHHFLNEGENKINL